MRFIAVLLLLLMVAPANAQSGNLEPVRALLTPDSIASPDQLNGRSAVLTITGVGATQTVALTPEGAFAVEKLSNDRYRVTIINGNLLSFREDGIWRWRNISLTAVSIIETELGTGIRGSASCNYTVSFSQVGAGQIDLTALQSAFNVRWDLTANAGSPDVRIEGTGLAVRRPAGQTTPFDLVLHLEHRSDPAKSLIAPAVTVPSCETQQQAPTTIVQYIDSDPSDCFTVEVLTVNSCPDCGPTQATFNVTAKNVCSQTVRCEFRFALGQGNTELRWLNDAWMTLLPNQTYTTSWSLSYGERLTDFWTSAPGLHDCRTT